MDRTRHIVLCACALRLIDACVLADPGNYEPADPRVGFNLVSFANFGSNGANVWRNAVQDLHDYGFRNVSVTPIRFFNSTTGAIASISSQAADLTHIAAGVARARQLGMSVTVNPFVIPNGYAFWRGDWNPSGTVATQFWSDYQSYITSVATMAQNNGAERLTVGSELKSITANTAHNTALTNVINAANSSFAGQIGYAANWDEYTNANLASTVWDNANIDYVGIDSYFPLATNAQADASGPHPDPTFIDLIRTNLNNRLDNSILPFAQSRKGGAGMPVVFTETGLIPFNRTTVAPYSDNPGFTQPVDQGEQINGFHALIDALDGRAEKLLEVDFWHWGMPGAEESFWYLNTHGVQNVPGSQFDESLGNPAANFLSTFVNTPEPCLATALSILSVLTCGRPVRRSSMVFATE